MKHSIACLFFLPAVVAAFTHPLSAPKTFSTVLQAAEVYTPLDGECKMNFKVELDSPKVATMDEIEKGKKVYCRCWYSQTFPLCDGAHMKHNEATGDNVGPLIVSLKKAQEEEPPQEEAPKETPRKRKRDFLKRLFSRNKE